MNAGRFKLLLAALAILAMRPGLLRAELPAALREVRFDQRLDEQVPMDLKFSDETGQPVRLGDYFGEKPVILVLAYYECPMLCTQVLNGLVRGMLDMPFTAGKDFNVVTVSFDPRETPALAAAKRITYLERYGRPAAAQGWHFLTGEQDAIHRADRGRGISLHLRHRSPAIRACQRNHGAHARGQDLSLLLRH